MAWYDSPGSLAICFTLLALILAGCTSFDGPGPDGSDGAPKTAFEPVADKWYLVAAPSDATASVFQVTANATRDPQAPQLGETPNACIMNQSEGPLSPTLLVAGRGLGASSMGSPQTIDEEVTPMDLQYLSVEALSQDSGTRFIIGAAMDTEGEVFLSHEWQEFAHALNASTAVVASGAMVCILDSSESESGTGIWSGTAGIVQDAEIHFSMESGGPAYLLYRTDVEADAELTGPDGDMVWTATGEPGHLWLDAGDWTLHITRSVSMQEERLAILALDGFPRQPGT